MRDVKTNTIIKLLLLIILIKGSISNTVLAQNNDNWEPCKKFVYWGDIKICLPILNDMTECYNNETIKDIADKTEYYTNTVLAYYITTDNYQKINNEEDFNNEEFFKIYAPKNAKGLHFTKSDLDYLAKSFDDKNWHITLEEAKYYWENNIEGIEIDKPVLIESYTLNNNSSSFVYFIKSKIDDTNIYIVSVINLLLIKNRCIFLAYYKEYTGSESITEAKNNNDYIIQRLFEENK